MISNSTTFTPQIACIEPGADNPQERFNDLMKDPIKCTIVVLCPIGLLMNILTIAATALIPNGKSVHSKLIISLGVSDMLITVGVGLHFLLEVAFQHLNSFAAKKSFVDFGFHATLNNLLVMAADHYLAIMRPLEYGQIMTSFCGYCILIGIWVTSLIAGFTDYFLTYYNMFEWQYIVLGATIFVFFVIIGIYAKIYMEVRNLIHRNRAIHREEIHDTKAIITTSLIIITFFLCWMPNVVFNIIVAIKVNTNPNAFNDCQTKKLYISLALFFFIPMVTNTLCDPLIYAVRLKMVQLGYRRMFFKLFTRQNMAQITRNGTVSVVERRSTTVTLINSNSLQESEMHPFNNDTGFIDENSTKQSKYNENLKEANIPERTSLCFRLNKASCDIKAFDNLYESDDILNRCCSLTKGHGNGSAAAFKDNGSV